MKQLARVESKRQRPSGIAFETLAAKLTKHAIKSVLILGALALAGQVQAAPGGTVSAGGRGNTAPGAMFARAAGHEVVTAATGGQAIPANTAGGAWTTLTGPVLTETYARDTGGPGLGTIILNVPAGFEFNPKAAVTVGVNSTGLKTINNVPNGGALPATVTPTQITITISAVSRGGRAFPDTLTFQNIQVRPIAVSPLASGALTESGTCVFRNLTLNSGTWGLLQEVTPPFPTWCWVTRWAIGTAMAART